MAGSGTNEFCGGWMGWLQAAKEKGAEALDMVRKDLAEFGCTMQKDTSHAVEVTSTSLKDTMQSESASGGAKDKLTKGLNTFLDGISKAIAVPPDDEGQIPITASFASLCQDRNEAQLHALQTDPDTYLSPPEASQHYATWCLAFDLDAVQGHVSDLLVSKAEVRALYTQLVPSRVSHAEFWRYYFYKKHQLEQQQARKEDLMKRAERSQDDDSNLHWEVDWSGDEAEDDDNSSDRDWETVLAPPPDPLPPPPAVFVTTETTPAPTTPTTSPSPSTSRSTSATATVSASSETPPSPPTQTATSKPKSTTTTTTAAAQSTAQTPPPPPPTSSAASSTPPTPAPSAAASKEETESAGEKASKEFEDLQLDEPRSSGTEQGSGDAAKKVSSQQEPQKASADLAVAAVPGKELVVTGLHHPPEEESSDDDWGDDDDDKDKQADDDDDDDDDEFDFEVTEEDMKNAQQLAQSMVNSEKQEDDWENWE